MVLFFFSINNLNQQQNMRTLCRGCLLLQLEPGGTTTICGQADSHWTTSPCEGTETSRMLARKCPERKQKAIEPGVFLGDWAMKNGDFPRHRQLEKIQAFCPTPSRLKRVSRLVKAPSRITNNSLPCHSPIGTADWMARLDHPNSEDTVCQKPDTVDCWAKLHPASLGWTNSQKSGFQGCLARLCCPGSGQNDHQTSNVVGSLATSHHQGFGQNDYQRSSCEDHPWLCLRWPQ